MLPPLSALRVFDAIGRLGGIRKAAAALDIDHSSVSRQLKVLEQWAGVPLVNREVSRNGYLTDQGRLYHDRISRAFEEIASASRELTHRGDNRRFRIWCAPGLASNWLIQRLDRFVADFPDMELEFVPTDGTPRFQVHEADAWLHYVRDVDQQPESDADLRHEVVARPPVLAVASPAYVQRSGDLALAETMIGAQLLHEADFDQWKRWFRKQGIAATDTLSGPKFGQAHLTLAAARRGQGIALANMLVIGDSLASGELVVAGSWSEVDLGRYVLTARRDRWRDRYVAGFRSWVVRAARAATAPA